MESIQGVLFVIFDSLLAAGSAFSTGSDNLLALCVTTLDERFSSSVY